MRLNTLIRAATSWLAAFTLAGPAGLAPAAAAPVSGQGTWGSTLQARDLDGDTVTDAFYDTALDITWLRNANVNGLMNWNAAKAWAENLVFGGYSDWRLPTLTDTGGPGCEIGFGGGTECGYNVLTASSELAHLWYVTLGNKAYCPPGSALCLGAPQPGWDVFNTGDFQDLQASIYWSGRDFGGTADSAWIFAFADGFQHFSPANVPHYALAVRSGDVGSTVPEPGALALTLPTLAALAWRRRRQAIDGVKRDLDPH